MVSEGYYGGGGTVLTNSNIKLHVKTTFSSGIKINHSVSKNEWGRRHGEEEVERGG